MKQPPSARRRIVYICDWLPPDYGAVGQYASLYTRELADAGAHVVLAGLTSGAPSECSEAIGAGLLTTIKLPAQSYEKSRLMQRVLWTFGVNTRLLARLWRHFRSADEIVFTGSPPLFLHWIAPANIILRKRLVYRISDFHPECLMAAMSRTPLAVRLLYRLTLFWRRRIDAFEVLGEDQRQRLVDIGIASDRIELKRDPSPVAITPDTGPLPRQDAYRDKMLLLYSGNWGVAHDVDTFVAAYKLHHTVGSGRFVLWLNAVGANAAVVEERLRREGLPLIRGKPVALDRLANLLVTPAAHLITLSDAFVGFVLPSKVYGCVASRKPILFVGNERSDVHLLSRHGRAPYHRVDIGDVAGCLAALELIADEASAATTASGRARTAGARIATGA